MSSSTEFERVANRVWSAYIAKKINKEQRLEERTNKENTEHATEKHIHIYMYIRYGML